MNTKLNNLLIFAFGVAVGAASTWHYVKRKYEQYAEEEIAAARGYEARRAEYTPQVKKEERPQPTEKSVKSKEPIDYSACFNGVPIAPKQSEEPKKEEPGNMKRPCVIPPDEYGDDEEYATITLTYYADGVVTDDDDHRISDIEDAIGFDSLNHFGEYEDDTVFVRNDKRNCYYEICLDKRKYLDVTATRPYDPDDDED